MSSPRAPHEAEDDRGLLPGKEGAPSESFFNGSWIKATKKFFSETLPNAINRNRTLTAFIVLTLAYAAFVIYTAATHQLNWTNTVANLLSSKFPLNVAQFVGIAAPLVLLSLVMGFLAWQNTSAKHSSEQKPLLKESSSKADDPAQVPVRVSAAAATKAEPTDGQPAPAAADREPPAPPVSKPKA